MGGLPSESILIITIEQDIAGVKGGSHIIRKDLEPFLLRDQFEVMKKKRKKRYEIKKKMTASLEISASPLAHDTTYEATRLPMSSNSTPRWLLGTHGTHS